MIGRFLYFEIVKSELGESQNNMLKLNFRYTFFITSLNVWRIYPKQIQVVACCL